MSISHLDHAKAAKDVMKAGIDVYTTKGTAGALSLSHHRLNIIEALISFKIGTWLVLPFATVHDTAEPVGFILSSTTGEKLCFITDSMYCKYRFTGVTHYLVEANFADDILQANIESGALPVEMKNRIIKTHFSLANVKEFLKANDLSKTQEIHLIHLSDGNSDADRFKREVMQVTGKPVLIA